jgi:Protein of unknown function (DUF2878)/Family of unknown function (DUF6134)
MFNVCNFIAYQLLWFACVLGAAHGYAWIGPAGALIFLIAHLALIDDVRSDVRLIGLAILAGFAVDTLLVQTGQIAFSDGSWPQGWQPYWMLALWAAFAATLNHSMRWVASRPIVAAGLGAVGGPLAYLAGAKLGALTLSSSQLALPAIGIAWSVCLYMLARASAPVARPRVRSSERAILSTMMIVAVLGLTWTAAASAREWNFDVFLDQKRIGEHRFVLREGGTQRELTSDATFNVKFLFFDAYRYRHEAREIWEGDCVERLEASTDDNGERLAVTAQREAASFVVTTDKGVNALDAPQSCVQTFAYWNPLILDAQRLLNPQTGEYQSVRVQPMGREILDGIAVERYRLTGTDGIAPPLQIDLWYATTREWMALESRTPDGRRLRYVRRP